jgi:hypothetical protein
VETALREWLQIQEPYFYGDRILRTHVKMGQIQSVLLKHKMLHQQIQLVLLKHKMLHQQIQSVLLKHKTLHQQIVSSAQTQNAAPKNALLLFFIHYILQSL